MEAEGSQPRDGQVGSGSLTLSGMRNAEAAAELPVRKGAIGDREVDVLRDTGCSTAVVRTSFVTDREYTGERRKCVLIDGTMREFETAKLAVSTPFFTGQLEALVMQSPLCDLIIGNVPGAKGPDDPAVAAAVETRGQRLKAMRPLSAPCGKQGAEATPLEIKGAQQDDSSLRGLFEAAKEGGQKEVRGGTVVFQVNKGLLYRVFTSSKTGRATSQLVVPSKFRERVMAVGHEALMSGHLGKGKTADRIMSSFYWPGAMADIKRFCASCDSCQRASPRGSTRKVPLVSAPLIDTPFRRVAVDLIGPISPPSGTKNRYILTMVDYATRYPEAVALRSIDTETVAEALVEMFSRVGVPSEILSDRGTQFTSALMREVGRLLGVKQLHTTPYHPQANGLVERFNGTLKGMLKKMCEERPTDWDRYLPAILFAYREAPQDSLGFSPFEMLYGRTVRGPISILKELWTNEEGEEEVKTTYQFVLDLKSRLEDTCRFAQEALKQSSQTYKKYFDKKAKNRQLQVGDKALLLLPTDHNKILMHWKGPFVVVGKVGLHDYRIDVNGQQKVFHINMLRKYTERNCQEADEATLLAGAAVIDTGEGDPEVEGHIVMPEFGEAESYQDVTLYDELDEVKKGEARALCAEFGGLMTERPGQTDLEVCDAELTTTQPVSVKPYPIPYATREIIAEEVRKMMQMGVIEPSKSSYAAPVVIVKKKSGEHRFCTDYRRLNNVIKPDMEAMPNIEDLFATMSSQANRYFSKIDLSKGYWQIKMSDRMREVTAFTTPMGLFQWKVMPFGLNVAPATFTRMMRKLLDGMKNVANFMDDILIFSETWEEHMALLREVFLRLKGANLTARPSKCQIGYPNLEFLGFMVGEGTKQPEQGKVAKMLELPRPTTKAEVRSLLGLIGFYREFVPNFAAITSPLSDMVKRGSPNKVEWTEAAERALSTVKERLASQPILKLPDMSKTFTLRTDASGQGLGAVLLQECDGKKFPVRYASRKLTKCEQGYATVEKECLAVVWGVQKFQKYLYGKEFVLETDHQPLSFLQKANLKNGRVLRWAMTLQPYRYRILYIPGRENVGADYMSRAGML